MRKKILDKNFLPLTFLSISSLLFASTGMASNLKWKVIDAGSGLLSSANSTYVIRTCTGQPSYGRYWYPESNPYYFLHAGFLASLLDSDGDSMPDEWELQYPSCLDPYTNDANEDCDNDEFPHLATFKNIHEYLYGTDPTNPDTDGDSMHDGWEVGYNLRPTDPSDCDEDPDRDSWNNCREYPDYNPRDPNSHPPGNAGNPYGTKVVCSWSNPRLCAYQEAVEHNIGRVRAMAEESAHWCSIETSRGTYDFSKLDPVISSMRAQGLNIFLEIKAGYWLKPDDIFSTDICPWIEPEEKDPECPAPNHFRDRQETAPPKSYQQWYDFVRAVVTHYKDPQLMVRYYETQSESNVCGYYLGTEYRYFDVPGLTQRFQLTRRLSDGTVVVQDFPEAILPVFYAAVHDANPEAVVVGGSLTMDPLLSTSSLYNCNETIRGSIVENEYCTEAKRRGQRFLEALLGNAAYYDRLGQHFLSFDTKTCEPYATDFEKVVTELHTRMKEKGIDKPIELTEQVYLRWMNDWVDENGQCKSETLECYAQSIFKQIILSFSLKDELLPIREVTWFAQFPFNSIFPSCSAPAIFWGMGILMYNRDTPWVPIYLDHPAGKAWTFISSRFSDVGDFDFSKVKKIGSTSLYKFTAPQSRHMVAGWCKGVDCSQEVDLGPAFSIPSGTVITVYDYKGNQEYMGPEHQVTFKQAPKLIEWIQ